MQNAAAQAQSVAPPFGGSAPRPAAPMAPMAPPQQQQAQPPAPGGQGQPPWMNNPGFMQFLQSLRGGMNPGAGFGAGRQPPTVDMSARMGQRQQMPQQRPPWMNGGSSLQPGSLGSQLGIR